MKATAVRLPTLKLLSNLNLEEIVCATFLRHHAADNEMLPAKFVRGVFAGGNWV
jgi:hypothetical protein